MATTMRDDYVAGLMDRHGRQACERLAESRVAIAGLGGLGSHIAFALTRLGVGHLRLIDFDVVEMCNLNRQNYLLRHIGMRKTEALREQLAAISPLTEVETVTVRLTPENVPTLLQGFDVVCEAFDLADQKAMLISSLLADVPDTPIVSASGMAGYDSSNTIVTTRPMDRLYLAGDLKSGASAGRGLMAPRVQLCAAHQANMVLRLLLGHAHV